MKSGAVEYIRKEETFPVSFVEAVDGMYKGNGTRLDKDAADLSQKCTSSSRALIMTNGKTSVDNIDGENINCNGKRSDIQETNIIRCKRFERRY